MGQKIRQILSDAFCGYHSEDQAQYLSPANYNPAPRMAGALAKLLRMLDYHANRNNEKQYLVHQRWVYGNVPLWVTTKILTFGQLSKFYGLLLYRLQSAIRNLA